jgi:hypothetical protein
VAAGRRVRRGVAASAAGAAAVGAAARAVRRRAGTAGAGTAVCAVVRRVVLDGAVFAAGVESAVEVAAGVVLVAARRRGVAAGA